MQGRLLLRLHVSKDDINILLDESGFSRNDMNRITIQKILNDLVREQYNGLSTEQLTQFIKSKSTEERYSMT